MTAGQRWTAVERIVRGVADGGNMDQAVAQVMDLAWPRIADASAAVEQVMGAYPGSGSCPDVELGERVALMLNTCAEVALTAQRVITNPSADSEAVIGHLGDLLAHIDFNSETLDTW